MIDPATVNLNEDPRDRIEEVLCNVWQDHVPAEIYRNGIKVAVAIHPDELLALREEAGLI